MLPILQSPPSITDGCIVTPFLFLYYFVLSTTGSNHHFFDDVTIDDDSSSDKIEWMKPQVADLKRFEPVFNTTNLSHSSHQRRKVTVTTVLEPPFVMLKESSHYITGNERFEGFLVDLLRHISTSLNFDFEIRLARDSKYGQLYMGRYWDGAIGEIHRKEADIAMGPIVMTNVTQGFVDFTQPLLSLRYSALIRKPKKNKRETHGKKSNSADKKSSRNEDEEIIKDISQLVSSGITCGVVRDSLAQNMLTSSSSSEHRAILSRISNTWPVPFVKNRQEGVARARAERYAFIVDTPIAEYEAGKQPCDLYTTEPFLDLVEYALALSKGATLDTESGERSLKEALDGEIMRLKRGDEMQMMYLHWWKDKCSLRDNESNGGDYEIVRWNTDENVETKFKKYGDRLPYFTRGTMDEESPYVPHENQAKFPHEHQSPPQFNNTKQKFNFPNQQQRSTGIKRLQPSKSHSEFISIFLFSLTNFLNIVDI